MTIEELSQLSDEELRVKVAEKLGFNRKEHWQPFMGGWVNIFTLPSFSTSLDAMHEAEKTMENEQVTKFEKALEEINTIDARVCDFSLRPNLARHRTPESHSVPFGLIAHLYSQLNVCPSSRI